VFLFSVAAGKSKRLIECIILLFSLFNFRFRLFKCKIFIYGMNFTRFGDADMFVAYQRNLFHVSIINNNFIFSTAKCNFHM